LKVKNKSNLLTNITFELIYNPWSKVVGSILFFGILYLYIKPNENTISIDDLKYKEITLTNDYESGSTRDYIKVSFTSKEFKCNFGITSGGTFDNWKSIEDAMKKSTIARIAFFKTEEKNLNNPQHTIRVYHLETIERGLIYDLNSFKKREEKYYSRVIGSFGLLFLIIFVVSIYKAIMYPHVHRDNL
jgi:hypothetical protein